ncbi:nos-1 [Pristionchus pacificus]|uniref:Nos-1 n=1 Tax=Pristionchus pacificus TaxID=54126 RepID=A0A454XRG0_PRIPA|nr:nos-1 [Pristionchus pacificus]|eukprot:PDM75251.1 nos-1 [Pristionchus pacificus]
MDGAAFASPRPNNVQRRPAKIVIPSDDQSRQYRRSPSGDSSTKVHLSFIPPGYRTPPYTSSSSGGSSPSSVSPTKNDQTHFKFDHRSLNAQYGQNGVYVNNGATVQMLSLKPSSHRHDPPKQLLTLASHQQQNYAPSESGYSQSSQSSCATSCYNIYGACQHSHGNEGKQLLTLRSYVNSEMAAQDVCLFCYQFAVHYANSRCQTPLPRSSDRGYWRGHLMKEGDRIVCPRLLRRVCSLCGATGQNAHLNNFCPIAKKHTSSY